MHFLSINTNISMSEENETPTSQFVEVGYVLLFGRNNQRKRRQFAISIGRIYVV